MEEWKNIKGYEGLYQISNLGRVKSLKLKSTNRDLIMSLGNSTNGYLQIILCKDNKHKAYRIHRLVAQAFIPNPNNFPCVNHIDEDKTNNNVNNLEWCTISYNNTYGTKLDKKRKKVLCITTGEIFNSIKECAEKIGVCPSMIVKCCKGKRKTAKSLSFKYIDSDNNDVL